MLGYMAENVRSGACDVVGYDELARLVARGWTLLDIRTSSEHAHGAIPGSTHIPLDRLREELDGQNGPFVVYCQVGQRGHTAAALLHERDIEARNLDGGYKTWLATRAARSRQPRLLVGCEP
jgi:rhodanese-related sulfurtransferase